jgi:hypothetical protein
VAKTLAIACGDDWLAPGAEADQPGTIRLLVYGKHQECMCSYSSGITPVT